ncbi:MAG: ABC transporter permease [Lachnospiraceae bacterium]
MKIKEENPFLKLKELARRIGSHRHFMRLMPLIFLVLLTFFFSVMTGGRFTSPTSLKIIFEQALIVGTVSTGAAFIFATGNVNLAMGATTVLTATIAGMVYNRTGSSAVMILVAVTLGIFIMVISALLSTVLKVRVMFVTIVMMTLLAALQQSILGGTTVSLPHDIITRLTQMKFSYIVFCLYFIVSVVLFHFTAIGRSQRMLGTNSVCAEQTGISGPKYLVLAFFIAGIGCGIGALLAIVRAGSIGANTLTSLNMDCMLALVLGGMSIFGGSRSSAYAGIIGAVTVCVLNQGMLMINVDSTVIQGVRGIIFLILVYTSQKRPQGLPAPEG